MKKGRSLKQSLGVLCGLIAASCAVLYSITLVYVLETAENKLMASVMDDMLQTVVTADILQGKPPRLDQVTRLYIEGDPTRQIPELFKNYPQGYTWRRSPHLHQNHRWEALCPDPSSRQLRNLGTASFPNRRGRISSFNRYLLFRRLVFGP